MAPVEKFSPKDAEFYKELIPAVKKAVSPHGVIRENAGEDEQTLEQYVVYTLGSSEYSATAVVLIGNDASGSDRIDDLDTETRPHRLIASSVIINAVKAELHNIRSNPQQT